jgi:hypothetical protein
MSHGTRLFYWTTTLHQGLSHHIFCGLTGKKMEKLGDKGDLFTTQLQDLVLIGLSQIDNPVFGGCVE